MNTVSKAFALIIITASIAIISFLTGELIGMKSGYAYTQKVTTPMDAAYTVSLINLIENDMNKEAKEMLETKLDNYIINHWSASQCKLIGLNPFIKEKSQNEMFYTTITHRKSNPSNNELVQNHLIRIEKEIAKSDSK
jgi:flagellar biosynthesis regulator FlbT